MNIINNTFQDKNGKKTCHENESEYSCDAFLQSVSPETFATHLTKIKYMTDSFFVTLLTEHDVYLCFQVIERSLDEIFLTLSAVDRNSSKPAVFECVLGNQPKPLCNFNETMYLFDNYRFPADTTVCLGNRVVLDRHYAHI